LATTGHLQEVVTALAGSRSEVEVLVPQGADPHTFEPGPSDLKKLSRAKVVFCNGAGLEGWLERALQNCGGQIPVIDVSQGMPLRRLGPHGEADPHIWMDPNLMIFVYARVSQQLVAMEPAAAAQISQRTQIRCARLRQLDAWAQVRLATIPPGRRCLVTSHDALGYFAARYHFRVVGSVVPSFSTEAAEASVMEIRELMMKMKSDGVPAIFSESRENPQLYRQIARESGVKLVPDLLLDFLGPADSPTATYEGTFRWNVERIAGALQ